MDQRVEKAIEIAYALRGKGLQNGRTFHVTVIFDKAKMVAIGHNDYRKSHPSKKFGEYRAYKPGMGAYFPCLHSEISALNKMHEVDERLTFVNVRIDNNGALNNAKPCPNCTRVLNNIGFKEIFYTDSDGIKYINKEGLAWHYQKPLTESMLSKVDLLFFSESIRRSLMKRLSIE